MQYAIIHCRQLTAISWKCIFMRFKVDEGYKNPVFEIVPWRDCFIIRFQRILIHLIFCQ